MFGMPQLILLSLLFLSKTALYSRLIYPIFRPHATACKITAFLRITQYLKTYNSTNNLSPPTKAEQKQKLMVN